MAKSKKPDRKSDSHHHGISSSRCMKSCKYSSHTNDNPKIQSSEKKEWEEALCAVCMEYPHNAVLLLCSSYEKGCRPYMCATSRRFSNCLQQYRKAATKDEKQDFETSDESKLLCPLCRGPVKGWTVVDPARKYLNSKKRTCAQDNCSFEGKYKDLRKHVKMEHPFARCPREVDPCSVEKWKKLENERDLSDVYSTIRSAMPGAIVVGDYVIERGYRGGSNYLYGQRGFGVDYDSFDDADRTVVRPVPGYRRGRYTVATRGGHIRSVGSRQVARRGGR